MEGCFTFQWVEGGVGGGGVFQMSGTSFLNGGAPHGGHQF